MDDSIIETSKDPKRPRGKICLLCDRKFMINRIYFSSFKAIDAQNLTIENQNRNTEKMMLDITAEKNDFEFKLENQSYELNKMQPEINRKEDELKSLQQELLSGKRELDESNYRLQANEQELE